jgi:branched-chain amino acid aminotransferase
MGIESDFIWMDGDLVPFADAKVHVMSHALHYGLGVFEGVRAYEQPDGKPGIWRCQQHIQRLFNSAKMCRLRIPYTPEHLVDVCLDVLDANRFSSAYLRPLVFTGMGELGLGARSNPIHVVIASWRWGAYVGEEALAAGIRLKTSTFVRHHPNAALQRSKVVGNYVNNILARYEANEDGYEEAVLLDNQGFVAEGTGENLFFVSDGVVFTPPAQNILPGITRGSIIDLLRHEGYEVREQLFGRDALYTADEIFLCGTAAEVTPVREVDRRAVGSGERPVSSWVQRAYADAVRGRTPWILDSITTRATAPRR